MRPTRATLKFFKDEKGFRAWLAKNHAAKPFLWIGYWKADSGKKGISYDQAVRAALAYGWIDGQGIRVNEKSHANRFTPRKPGSVWSLTNLKRIKDLKREGLMRAPGLKAFEGRDKKKAGLYSFEQKRSDIMLDAASLRAFKKNAKAWSYFNAEAPFYKRTTTWWSMSAKRPETKAKRLAQLIKDSVAGRRLAIFTKYDKKKTSK